MTVQSTCGRKARSHASGRAEQRGVVLFIALIVMVAMSLAGIALIRSTDTAGIVAGNLAFKQAATNALDRSVEAAVHGLWDKGPDRPSMRRVPRARTISPAFNLLPAAASPRVRPFPRFRTHWIRQSSQARTSPARASGRTWSTAAPATPAAIRATTWSSGCASTRGCRSLPIAICPAPRSAPIREPSTTSGLSGRAMPITASRSGRGPAQHGDLRAGDLAGGAPVEASGAAHNEQRSTRIQEGLRRRVAALLLQPFGAWSRDHDSADAGPGPDGRD